MNFRRFRKGETIEKRGAITILRRTGRENRFATKPSDEKGGKKKPKSQKRPHQGGDSSDLSRQSITKERGPGKSEKSKHRLLRNEWGAGKEREV